MPPKNKTNKSSPTNQSSSASVDPITDLKTRGNEAFQKQNYALALDLYTQAINSFHSQAHVQAKEQTANEAANVTPTEPQTSLLHPPTNQLHPLAPLFSNRSATHLALKNNQSALTDADFAVSLAPHWPKGYLRRGQALEQLLRYHDAVTAYQTGLTYDSNDVILKKCLDDLDLLLNELKLSRTQLAQAELNPESDRFTRMVNWLQSNGAQFPKLYLQYYSEDYRGVHCLTRIPVDDVILYVPHNLIMTSQVAMASEIGKKVVESGVELRSKHSYLACYLLQEREKGAESFWYPYIQCLPAYYSNMPIFFNDETLALLQGSFTLAKITDRTESLRAEYEAIKAVVPELGRFPAEDFVWARLVVITRIFGLMIHGTKTDGLVPFADMLNHKKPRDSCDTDTKWTFDDLMDGFTITSMRSIARGEQVYDSYGRKCNSRFFVNYGFSLEHNEDDNEAVLNFPSLSMHDPTLIMKRRMLPPHMQANAFNAREFQVPATYRETSEREKKTKEMFSYLRFVHAVDSEMMMLTTNSAHGSIKIEDLEPISVRNERKVLLAVQRAAQDALDAFDTTLEEDEQLLESNKYPQFTNERNCVLQRRGEKQVLHWYLSLAKMSLELLELPWKDLKKRTAKVGYASTTQEYYINNVLAPLKKKEL